MAVLMVLSFRQSFFAHIVIHVTLSRVTLALLGSVFQTERFVESISKPSISFNLYCDCLAFLLKDEINFLLLKSGWDFTQKWMEFYSKVERNLLKIGAKFTQNWSEIYSKLEQNLLKIGTEFTQNWSKIYSKVSRMLF